MCQSVEELGTLAQSFQGYVNKFKKLKNALTSLCKSDSTIGEAVSEDIIDVLNDGSVNLGSTTAINNVSNSIMTLAGTPTTTRALTASNSISTIPPKLDNPLQFLNYIKV